MGITEGDPASPLSTFGGNANNPHFRFTNNQRGYVRVLAEPGVWRNEFRVVQTIRDPASPVSTAATFVVEHGKPGAVNADGVVSPV